MMFEPEVACVLPDGDEMKLTYNSAANEYSGNREFTVNILCNSELIINGNETNGMFPVAGTYTTEETERLSLFYNRYRIRGSYGVFVPTASDYFKTVTNLQKDGNGQFSQAILYDENLKSEYGSLAETAAVTYCEYMTNDSSLTEVRRFFASGTPTYEAIRTSEVIWYTNHIGYRFENISSSEFYRHDDETFSCRVTLDHYVVRTSTDTHYFPLHITMFFKESDGEMKVWEMVTNK